MITVCPYLASLVMPNGDPPGGFIYPTLTIMMDSYIIFIGVAFLPKHLMMFGDVGQYWQLVHCQTVKLFPLPT